MDITNGVNQLVNMLLQIMQDSWNKLESITIWETSLLQMIITIFVLSVVIPIIFTLVKSGSATGSKAIKSEISKKRKSK